MAGHLGGRHPEGGFRTEDLMEEKKPPRKFTAAEKVVGWIIGGPILAAIVIVLISAVVKLAQICWAWIS